MNRRILSCLASVLALALLAGCGSAPSAAPTAEENAAGLPNPVKASSPEEIAQRFDVEMKAPDGAEELSWVIIEGDMPLAQLGYSLDGIVYNYRIAKAEAYTDISGMYYEWSAKNIMSLTNWKQIKGTYYRWFDKSSSEGYADLCTWYDAETGISYSLSVTADDLDGFDLQAIVEYLYAPEK